LVLPFMIKHKRLFEYLDNLMVSQEKQLNKRKKKELEKQKQKEEDAERKKLIDLF